MSSSTGVARTATTVARRRVLVTTIVMLLGAALSLTVTAFAAFHDSSTAAIRQEVHADFGYRQYVLQSANPSVAQKVKAHPEIRPVVDDDGTLTAHGLTAQTLIRSTTDPALTLGVLTSGRRPSGPGEAAISEVLARSLRVHVGDAVAVAPATGSPTKVMVSGLLVDPSDSSAQVMAQVVAPSATFKPTRWLSDSNPVDDPDLGPHLSPPATVVASAKSAVPLALETQPRVVSTLRFLPAGAGAILGLLLLGILAGLAGRWRSTAVTLQAAGMPARSSWLVFLQWVAAAVVAGEVLGIAAALVLMSFFKRSVSGWLGQAWVGVEIPVREIAVMLACTAALAAAALPCLQRAMGPDRTTHALVGRRHPAQMWVLVVWFAAGGYWAYLAFIDDSGAESSLLVAVLVGALALVLTPYALEPLLAEGLYPGGAKHVPHPGCADASGRRTRSVPGVLVGAVVSADLLRRRAEPGI